MPYLAVCDNCRTPSPVLTSAKDPHPQVVCKCCPKSHHHGKAANQTGKPCRSITVFALGRTAELKATV